MFTKKASGKAWKITVKKAYSFYIPCESKAACWRIAIFIKIEIFDIKKEFFKGFAVFRDPLHFFWEWANTYFGGTPLDDSVCM